jgi:hypothetical protein
MADTFSHAQRPGGSRDDDRWHGQKTNNVRRPISNDEIETAAAILRERQGLSQPASQTRPDYENFCAYDRRQPGHTRHKDGGITQQ